VTTTVTTTVTVASTGNLPGLAGGMVAIFETQCQQGDAQGCIVAGTMYQEGQAGVAADTKKARALYERACTLGEPAGCTLRDTLGKKR
jgi:TPR repeat protein